VGAVDRPYDDHTPKGTVLATNPAFGAALPKGSAVGLTIANGPHPVALPNLRGDTLDQAKATLAQLGLPFTELTQNDQTVPAGSVISTTPGAGDVEPGTTITVVVSLGPVIVSVPDVTGESVAQAQQDLANVGLKVGNIYGPHDGRSVFSTSPSAGARVPQGTAVDLYVKHG
jgi:serine/threonine-protein kinase